MCSSDSSSTLRNASSIAQSTIGKLLEGILHHVGNHLRDSRKNTLLPLYHDDAIADLKSRRWALTMATDAPAHLLRIALFDPSCKFRLPVRRGEVSVSQASCLSPRGTRHLSTS